MELWDHCQEVWPSSRRQKRQDHWVYFIIFYEFILEFVSSVGLVRTDWWKQKLQDSQVTLSFGSFFVASWSCDARKSGFQIMKFLNLVSCCPQFFTYRPRRAERVGVVWEEDYIPNFCPISCEVFAKFDFVSDGRNLYYLAPSYSQALLFRNEEEEQQQLPSYDQALGVTRSTTRGQVETTQL